MQKEIWRVIPGWENYMVSNLGRVKSLNYLRTGKEKILSLSARKNGKVQAPLYKDGRCYRKYVHYLMALAFIPIPERLKNVPFEDLVVHHKDFGSENRLDNLEWLTKDEHDALHGLNRRCGKGSKKVAQYALDYPCELIRVWNSLGEIKRAHPDYCTTNISKCCRNIYGFKTAYGFSWAWWED